jgi:hypothetical protein
MEIVESAIGGKFQIPVATNSINALESISDQTSDPLFNGPLATLEVWSLEAGCYDLVLKLPLSVAQKDSLAGPLIDRFIDHAHRIAQLIDATDRLRSRSGPTLTLRKANHLFNRLEVETAARLDVKTLMQLLKTNNRSTLN